MKNKTAIKNGRYSKSKLRDLAVILAAYQILHMEENELVRKITDEKDVPVDISSEAEIDLEKAVRYLEKQSLLVLSSNKIHPEDNDFFVEKCGIILEEFFNGFIADRGVSPHVAFTTLLFSYFAEYTGKKHGGEFQILLNTQLYDAVFDHLEDSIAVDWWDHYHTSLYALSKGVGISLEYRLPPPAVQAPLLRPLIVRDSSHIKFHSSVAA